MLPAKRDANAVQLHRSLDASEEELLDALSDFAVRQDLEVDHTWDGDGLVFRRARTSAHQRHVFKRGDSLHVKITAIGDLHDIEFAADISGSVRRRTEARTRRIIRGGVLSAGFVALGVAGLTHGVNVGDFVLLAIGGGFGRRMARRLAAADADRDAIARTVANTLARLCARVEDPDELVPGDVEPEYVDDDDDDD